MVNKQIPINDYQREILNHVQKDYLKHGAMMSCAALSSYWYVCHHEYDFPADFLNNPIPENASSEVIDFAKRAFWYYGEETVRLPEYEQLQVLLVFLYHTRIQDQIDMKIAGTPWADLGWRPLLKCAVGALKTTEERIEYLDFFITEFAYLQTK